jgi:hypothetical protein
LSETTKTDGDANIIAKAVVASAAAAGAAAAAEQEDSDLCKCCYANPIDCVLLPCGHFAICIACSKLLPMNLCPLCREVILEAKPIFR